MQDAGTLPLSLFLHLYVDVAAGTTSDTIGFPEALKAQAQAVLVIPMTETTAGTSGCSRRPRMSEENPASRAACATSEPWISAKQSYQRR